MKTILFCLTTPVFLLVRGTVWRTLVGLFKLIPDEWFVLNKY